MSFVTVNRNRGKAFVQAVLAQDAANIAAQEAEIARRVRSEVAKLRGQAEAEGRAAGEELARAAMAPEQEKLALAAAALESSLAQLAAPLAQKEHELAGLVTELAFLLAKHIIGLDASTNPQALAELVTALLTEAAGERGPRQSITLRLNPIDHAKITPSLPANAAIALSDPNIAQGGAMLEITAPDGDPIDKIEWDATLMGRLDTLRTALALPDSGSAP